MEPSLLLDLLVLDAERVSGVEPENYTDNLVQYVVEVYSVASHRAQSAPPLHKQAWLRLAEYVTFSRWDTLNDMYRVFHRLYPSEQRSLLSILPRGVSFWHLRACLWVWSEGQVERLEPVVRLHCFLNMTPQEAEDRLRHAYTLNTVPYLFRLSTTQVGQITLSFVGLRGRVVHMRLNQEAVLRFVAQHQDEDLYSVVFNEAFLELGQPPFMTAAQVLSVLNKLDARISLSDLIQRLLDAETTIYESHRLPELLRRAFYANKHSVPLQARSLNELVGLTASYVSGYQ